MPFPPLTEWNDLTAGQQISLARAVEKQLPQEFAFKTLRRCSLGQITQNIAIFAMGTEATFALVPGGEVILGFDARSWHPNVDEEQSWQGTAQKFGIEESLNDYINQVTTPLRHVVLPPLLIETVATEVGWEPVSLDTIDVKALLNQLPSGDGPYTLSKHWDDQQIRVTRTEGGKLIAQMARPTTHEALSSELKQQGFRFPTFDEWEYACGGGARMLFRWGDHVLCDRYPTDISPAEAAWRREWVLSGGQLPYPESGFTSDWSDHKQPNAFGLLIATDPYKNELIAELNATRGGDGGCTICGGSGFLMGWLTLATAYFEPQFCCIEPDEGLSIGYTVGRKVLPIE